MANVLLGWELGMGLWHARLLRQLGRGLRDLGHTVTYAVANPVDTWSVLGKESATVLQAPIALPRSRAAGDDFEAHTFADIVFEAGFYAPEVLSSLVGVWDGLLSLTKPDLVICDHAPSLLVACHGRTPVVQVGLGFTQPPSSLSPIPSFVPPHDGSSQESVALNSLQTVLSQRGHTPLNTLASLYDTSARFVTTFAEFDPFNNLRTGPYIGPLDELPAPLPPAQVDGYFAYLSADVPAAVQFLRHLATSDCPGEVFLRGAHPNLVRELRSMGLSILDEPASMETVLEKYAFVIHHGGVGTSQKAAAAGRPQLLLPWHLEQAYNSAVLVECGLGECIYGAQSADETIQRLMSSESITNRARSFAALIEARRNTHALETVLTRCQSLL